MLDELRARVRAEHPELIELESILTALAHLPSQTARDLASVRERQREKEVVKRRLRDLTAFSETVRRHIDQNVARYNGSEKDPASVDAMDRLLDEQAYRLCHWRAAFDEINYRRFFDINELAAISMESPDVFWRTHTLVRSLLADGSLSGLRIDHIDGLFDPERYLLRLQWAYLADLGQTSLRPAGCGNESCATAGRTGRGTAPGRASRSASGMAPRRPDKCCVIYATNRGCPGPKQTTWWRSSGPRRQFRPWIRK